MATSSFINAARIVCGKRLFNGQVYVRLSVPLIDSNSDLLLLCRSLGAGGRYRSERSNQRAASML